MVDSMAPAIILNERQPNFKVRHFLYGYQRGILKFVVT